MTNEIKNVKKDFKDLQQQNKTHSEKLKHCTKKLYKLKKVSKIFQSLFENCKTNQLLRKKNNVLVNQYFLKRRRQIIFNSWRNITNSISKGRMRLKYTQEFNEKSEEIQNTYSKEVERMRNILEKLEIDITKEMEERRNLAYLYDLSMNKGVEQFLRETNYIINFDSSSNFFVNYLDVITPNERSIHHSQ
jgi:hypothetical protein